MLRFHDLWDLFDHILPNSLALQGVLGVRCGKLTCGVWYRLTSVSEEEEASSWSWKALNWTRHTQWECPPSSNTASDFPVILHQTYKGYTESYQRPAVRQNLFTSVHTYNAAQTRGLDLCRRLGTKLQRHLGTIRLNATGCTGTGCREDSGARADHIPDDIKS